MADGPSTFTNGPGCLHVDCARRSRTAWKARQLYSDCAAAPPQRDSLPTVTAATLTVETSRNRIDPRQQR